MSLEAVTAVLAESKVEHGTRLVAICLASHADSETGEAFPGLRTIMAETRLSRTAVYGALAELRAAGEIEEAGKRGRVTKWRLLLPSIVRNREKVPNRDSNRPESGRRTVIDEQLTDEKVNSQPECGGGVGGDARRVPIPDSLPIPDAAATSAPPPVVAILRAIAERKKADLDPAAVARSCARYRDRDLLDEAEAFAFWHLEGRGQNRRPRNLARAWDNWLRSAAPANAPTRRRGQSAARVSNRVQELLARSRGEAS